MINNNSKRTSCVVGLKFKTNYLNKTTNPHFFFTPFPIQHAYTFSPSCSLQFTACLRTGPKSIGNLSEREAADSWRPCEMDGSDLSGAGTLGGSRRTHWYRRSTRCSNHFTLLCSPGFLFLLSLIIFKTRTKHHSTSRTRSALGSVNEWDFPPALQRKWTLCKKLLLRVGLKHDAGICAIIVLEAHFTQFATQSHR